MNHLIGCFTFYLKLFQARPRFTSVSLQTFELLLKYRGIVVSYTGETSFGLIVEKRLKKIVLHLAVDFYLRWTQTPATFLSSIKT